MQNKQLIAAVVGGMLAAPAAFAQITISGTVKDGFEMYKLGAGNAAAPATSYHYEPRVSDQSSRIIFSGTQDLGGGLRAWFQLDSRFQSDVGGSTQTNTGTTTGINLWAGGNTGVGLAGDWGKLTIGRWDWAPAIGPRRPRTRTQIPRESRNRSAFGGDIPFPWV